jgi:hypothetical protein
MAVPIAVYSNLGSYLFICDHFPSQPHASFPSEFDT